MKKTLLLMALLGGIPAQAEVVTVFAEGYTADNYASAYNNAMVGRMCWGANAANIISWWQDRLEAQGYTLPEGTPTKNNVYAEYQAGLLNKGGYPDSAVEWWLDGYYYGSKISGTTHTGNFYDGLLKPMDHNNYSNEGTLIKQFFPATCGSRSAFSKSIVDCLQDGYALIVDVGNTSVTVWGADYDADSELLTHVYYSDLHYPDKVYHGALSERTDAVGYDTFYIAGTGTMSQITGISCHIEDYLTEAAYTDTGDGCFAPVYNVQLTGGTGYVLDKALKANDKVNADVTISNGSVTVAESGSTEGSVIFSGAEGDTRKLSVQRVGLVLSAVQMNADATLEVTGGNDVTITAATGDGLLVKVGEGTLVNGGSLGSIELQEGALKGSGTFGAVTVDGGTLIVGNSPGHQVYTDMLTVTDGELVFCVAGWETPSTAALTGWESESYSAIDMGGNAFAVSEEARIFIDLKDAAANSLTLGGPFSLELVTNMGNSFTADELMMLAGITEFRLSDEEAAAVTFRGTLTQPAFSYKMVGNSLMLSVVPEPATVTLSLLALTALAARRRRKEGEG